MPRKYKSLIPLLEGEEFDYSNELNFTDDAVPSDRLPKYFEVSTGDYDVTGEDPAPSVAENVQRALSCYQLRTSGLQVHVVKNAHYTSGAIILKTGVHLIPGRYECRVMLPKKSNSVFSFRLFGRYTDRTRGQIDMSTPSGAVEGNIYNNIRCATNNTNSDPVRDSKVCIISKDLNDGNFHTIGWDWYYSEHHKCVKFFIDNTELTTLNVAPNFPMVLYVVCAPDPYLSVQRGDFDYDYAEVDYIRFTAFANQTINTTGTFQEDTNRGGAITTTVSDNVIIPRILKASYNGGAEVVVSKTTKDQQEIIMRNINQGNKKFTIDTNGNRDAYDYGTNSNSLDNKLIIPTSVDATVDNKKANYPVIQSNARARLKKIEGNSIVWNQLCPNFKETINGQLRQCWYRDGGDMTITEEDGELVATLMASDPTVATFRLRPYAVTANSNLDLMRNLPTRYHKVLFKFDARAEGTDTYDWGNWYLYLNGYYDNSPRFPNTMKSGEWTTFTYIQEMTLGDMVACFFNPSITWTSGIAGKNIGYSMRRVMIFDLTLMFGKGNEPTIEEFNRLFPNTYYPWVAEGELKKTTINSIKSYDKDGTELDSIDKLTNIDLISATTHSKYHQSIEVSNNINLSAYTHDGAETYTINKISNVNDKDLSKFNFTLASTTDVSPIWWSVWDSTMNTDAAALSYDKISPILSNKYSSSRPHDTQFESTYNKFISFGGNAGQIFISDNSITTDMKLYLNNIKGKTRKYTQSINPANYLNTQTISGVTFTVNKTTGEILVNGTATEDIEYKVNAIREGTFIPTAMILLKGCPSGGSDSTYYLRWSNIGMHDTGSGNYAKLTKYGVFTDTINIWLGIYIIIKSGTVMNNKRFYPQLFNVSDMYGLGKEPKTIADFNKDFPHSFYPYSNREIRSVAIKQLSIKPGYKNLLDKTKFAATQTINGVTFTNNGDGSYTLNGTATNYAYFHIQTFDIPVSSNNSVVKYLMRGYEFEPGDIAKTVELYLDNFYVVGSGLLVVHSKKGNIVERNNIYNPTNVLCRIRVAPNYTCNNLVIRPQLINLTDTYGEGNEPTTVEQFQADFPNIDDIPYAEQKITFASPIILNGINTAQDILKIVKDNYQYSLVKEEHIGNVDLGTTPVSQVYRSYETGHKYYQVHVDDIKNSASYSLTNVLMSRYTTATEPSVYGNVYNLTISAVPGNLLMIYDKDAYDNMTNQEFLDSLAGQILYYERKTPVTTTLYSLTPSNVAALFAKGYYIEVVGNDTNKDIIRPDVTVNIPCLNGTSYIDKEITFTNLDKEAIDRKMTGLTYHKKAIFRKELQGIHAYYGAKDTTTTELYSGLSFEDISLQIAEGGYIEVDYTGVQPNVSFDFPVQLYKIYEASYGKVDVVALDSQLQNAKYNTSLQLNNVKGRSVKWTQLVDKSNLVATTTKNGITFTNNGDGTFTLNGTATATAWLHIIIGIDVFQGRKYLLKGCPTGGSESTYKLYVAVGQAFAGGVFDYGAGNIRQCLQDGYIAITIEVASGYTCNNVRFRPQFFNVSDIYGMGKEPSSVADFNKDYPYSIYPYGKQEILTTKVSGIKIRAGYKNLIAYFEPTTTISGVTITNNNDGTFTCNGTASADINFRIANAPINMSVDNTSIMGLLKGCPSGGSESTYYLCNTWTNSRDYGQGVISRIERAFPTTIYLDMNVFIKQGTVCNNLVFKPQLINLTNTYGAGNEPKTVAQFNQDFPDIDNIPYPEQTISFSEQTLYGINDISKTKDELNIVKNGNVYELQLIKRMSVISDISLQDWQYYPADAEYGSSFRLRWNNTTGIQGTWNEPTILCPKYSSMVSGWMQEYKYNKLITNSLYYFYIIDKDYTDVASFKKANEGVPLYYTLDNPTTTTLATLTKNQITALFAKGYCVEILGNDDNKIIVRPDLTLSIPIYPEEIVQTVNVDDIDVSDTNIEQEDTTTENFNENGSSVDINETTEESTSDHIN